MRIYSKEVLHMQYLPEKEADEEETSVEIENEKKKRVSIISYMYM